MKIKYGRGLGIVLWISAMAHTAHAGVLNVAGDLEANDKFGFALAAGYFDGDDFADLVVGVPGEDGNRGAINIMYGGTGFEGTLGTHSNRLLKQDAFDVDAAANDWFGAALAAGDFDGNGVDDIAIGIPNEDYGTVTNAGRVIVVYGDGLGISASSDFDVFNQTGSFSASHDNENYGQALLAADLNCDNVDDLVVGIPGEEVDGMQGAGGVHIMFGKKNVGLVHTGELYFNRNSKLAGGTIDGDAHAHERFGWSLAAGNFSGNLFCDEEDLAIGIPGLSVNGHARAGGIMVIRSLSGFRDDVFHQGNSLDDDAAQDDQVGYSLAAGDINADGRDDLAVGAPGESGDGGAINVLYGSDNGLMKGADDMFVHQDTAGVQGERLDGGYFGWAVHIEDYNADGSAELTVGSPFDPRGDVNHAGTLNNFTDPNGTSWAADQFIDQSDFDSQSVEANDSFGWTFSSGDFDGDGSPDLAIGVPYESWNGSAIPSVGVVHVVHGGTQFALRPDDREKNLTIRQ